MPHSLRLHPKTKKLVVVKRSKHEADCCTGIPDISCDTKHHVITHPDINPIKVPVLFERKILLRA